MKLRTPRRLAATDLAGEWEDDSQIVLGAFGEFQDQTTQLLGGNLSSENTTSTYGAYLLKHGTETRIKNPLAERGLRCQGVYAVRCVGVRIGSDNRPSRELYDLSTPRIDWKTAGDNLLITAEYDLRHTEPTAELALSANQTITTGGAGTAIQWDSNTISADEVISVENNSEITVSEPGYYVFTGHIAWTANATGVRLHWFSKNGAGLDSASRGVHQDISAVATSAYFAEAGVAYSLVAGDYVELRAVQTSGGDLAVRGTSGGSGSTKMQVFRTRNDSTPTGKVTLFFFGG